MLLGEDIQKRHGATELKQNNIIVDKISLASIFLCHLKVEVINHPHFSWLLESNKVIFIVKVKLAVVVEGDQKAPFSITTTLRCRGGCYSFPRIAPLYP